MTKDDAPPPLQPIAPHLQPMIDATVMAEKEARAAAEAAQREEEERKEREADAESIRRAFKKGGLKSALAVGRTYGWDEAEIHDLFATSDDAPAAEGERRFDDDGEEIVFRKKPNPVKALPADCPVTPLGMGAENVCFYLSPEKILVAIDGHSADRIRMLFGSRNDWLWSFLPKFNQKGEQTGWKADRMADSLIAACGRRGVFSPGERLRGVGAWQGADGRSLVLHCGDAVFIDGEWVEPGYHGGHVYPGASPLWRPADAPPSPAMIADLLRLFDTWPWASCLDDATGQPINADGSGHRLSSLLLLGWIGCAMVGGALDWRPMIWLTGDAGSGKSTLQGLIKLLLGGALMQSADATAAGVYQAVGYGSVSVGIDEAESDPTSMKMKNMVDLVRASSSGSIILRGSNDARWRGFSARSAFVLSSILIPPLDGADMTRVTVLRLGTLPKTVETPKFAPEKYQAMGRAMLRRILDNWPRWTETLERYRMALGQTGHDNRAATQMGTLLAMSDMLRFDGDAADTDTVTSLAQALPARNDIKSNAEQMLDWLLSKPLQAFRGGEQMTVEQLVGCAAGYVRRDNYEPDAYIGQLTPHGIYVEGRKESAWVFLANNHAGLEQIFRDTRWYSKPGSQVTGWSQAMHRLASQPGPDGKRIGSQQNSRRYGGRAWGVPAWFFLRRDGPEPTPDR